MTRSAAIPVSAEIGGGRGGSDARPPGWAFRLARDAPDQEIWHLAGTHSGIVAGPAHEVDRSTPDLAASRLGDRRLWSRWTKL